MEEFNLDAFESYAKIVVIGVGGAGCNAVNQMVEEQIRGVTFWICNTDAQALANSQADHRLILGKSITRGLGAGGNPLRGKEAALASEEDLREIVSGANMVFIASGMGGGTGTGAAPVVARIAKEAGALTLAIVTRPFSFEGENRKKNAVEGINELKENVDSIIIVSNDKLMMMNGTRAFSEAFKESDRVLAQSVKTITDLIVNHEDINLDFADLTATLENKGLAVIGFGKGKGPKKALDAASSALLSPLLEASIEGAKRILLCITCGKQVTLDEVRECVDHIRSAAGDNPNVIFGISNNQELDDEMFVSIVATEFDNEIDLTDVSRVDLGIRKVDSKGSVPVAVEDEDDEESILPSFMSQK